MSKRFLPSAEQLPRDLQAPPLAPDAMKESPLLKALGITEKYVLNEYMKVVNQDEDLSNKLKALRPLAKEIGLDLDGSTAPGITNNIIVMPNEIVKKHDLSTSIIVADIPPTPELLETTPSSPYHDHQPAKKQKRSSKSTPK
jgi:hypothetical protein